MPQVKAQHGSCTSLRCNWINSRALVTNWVIWQNTAVIAMHLFWWQHVIFIWQLTPWPYWCKLATELKLARLQKRRLSSTAPAQTHRICWKTPCVLFPVPSTADPALSCWSSSQLWGEGYRYSLDKSAVNQTDTWRQTILSMDNQGCQSARHARLWTCGRHRQNNPTHNLLAARWLRWPLHHSNPLPHHRYSKSCSPFKAKQEYNDPGTFESDTGLALDWLHIHNCGTG